MTKKDMRAIAKCLAGEDREAKAALVHRRREAGLKQSDIDEALGVPDGWTHDIEAYDSDPSLSDMRRYEAYVTYIEGCRDFNPAEEVDEREAIFEEWADEFRDSDEYREYNTIFPGTAFMAGWDAALGAINHE
jgi:hypothetical protein